MGSLSVVRSMLALLGALLLASVTACSGPTDTDAAAPKRYIETAQVSQAAKDRYGEQAQAAYRELATFSLEEWLKPAVLDPQTPPSTAEQLSEGITPRLVRSTVVRWNQQVAAAVAGDRQALEDISLLRLDTLDAPTLSLPPRGDPVVSQSITAGKVSLGEVGTGGLAPLVVSFTQDADLSMRDGRRPYDLSLHKPVEFDARPRRADVLVGVTGQETEAGAFAGEVSAETEAQLSPATVHVVADRLGGGLDMTPGLVEVGPAWLRVEPAPAQRGGLQRQPLLRPHERHAQAARRQHVGDGLGAAGQRRRAAIDERLGVVARRWRCRVATCPRDAVEAQSPPPRGKEPGHRWTTSVPSRLRAPPRTWLSGRWGRTTLVIRATTSSSGPRAKNRLHTSANTTSGTTCSQKST